MAFYVLPIACTVLRNAFKAFLAEHPNVVGIISSMKALIRYVNKSSEAAQTLLHVQVTENEPIRKLIQETEIRWNSLCDSMESIQLPESCQSSTRPSEHPGRCTIPP